MNFAATLWRVGLGEGEIRTAIDVIRVTIDYSLSVVQNKKL